MIPPLPPSLPSLLSFVPFLLPLTPSQERAAGGRAVRGEKRRRRSRASPCLVSFPSSSVCFKRFSSCCSGPALRLPLCNTRTHKQRVGGNLRKERTKKGGFPTLFLFASFLCVFLSVVIISEFVENDSKVTNVPAENHGTFKTGFVGENGFCWNTGQC